MTSKELRDVVLITAPGVVAMAAFVLGHDRIPGQWLTPAAFGVNFLLQIAVKALVPDHQPLRLFSWPPFLLIIALIMAFIVLVSDWNLLGWWTPLALFVLAIALLSMFAVAVFADKKDDGAPRSD